MPKRAGWTKPTRGSLVTCRLPVFTSAVDWLSQSLSLPGLVQWWRQASLPSFHLKHDGERLLPPRVRAEAPCLSTKDIPSWARTPDPETPSPQGISTWSGGSDQDARLNLNPSYPETVLCLPRTAAVDGGAAPAMPLSSLLLFFFWKYHQVL